MGFTYTFVLAGGKGERLLPLTRERSKPAVPFGGVFRIIDFTLSNCLNSGLRHVSVLTQYKSLSLESHIQRGWRVFDDGCTGSIATLPPQQRVDDNWYLGTANAVFQNLYAFERFTREWGEPEVVLVLAGDHVYKMDYQLMLSFHAAEQADVTVGVIRTARAKARRRFGVLEVSPGGRVVRFEEKPDEPAPIPGDPWQCHASMGIYAFRPRVLREWLLRDSRAAGSTHDFGRDLLPRMIESQRVLAFPFALADRSGNGYWRDVGTLASYYRANLDLLGATPALDVCDRRWPIRSTARSPLPTRVTAPEATEPSRVVDSLVAPGCAIAGCEISRSVLSPDVSVHPGARVEESVLLDGVVVGRGARVRRAVLDKYVVVPEGEVIDGLAQSCAPLEDSVDAGLTVISRSRDRSGPSPTAPREAFRAPRAARAYSICVSP